jgi:GT2 family glycosyltransferase
MGRLIVPAGCDMELILVDNGSSDQTPHVIDSFQPARMKVRHLTERGKGKSCCLNTAIAAAAGEILAFIDDDVRPDANWIVELDRAFVEAEVMAVQGKVVCVYDPPLPDWYDATQLGGLAEVDLGPARRSWIKDPCVGANMAFRRTVVDRVGNFRPFLGPGQSGFFDDTEFSWRMHEAGMRIDYLPEAFVYHHPFASRLTRAQLWRAWFRNGSSSALAIHCSGRGRESAPGLSLVRRFIRVAKLKIIAVLNRRPPSISQDEMLLWMHLGSAYVRLQGPASMMRGLTPEAGRT